MDAKFVAASEVACELFMLHQMLGEVGMEPVVLMLMHVDIQAAISQIEGEASSIKSQAYRRAVQVLALSRSTRYHHGAARSIRADDREPDDEAPRCDQAGDTAEPDAPSVKSAT